MIATKKVKFISNWYLFEGGGVIIKKRTNILIKKTHIAKGIIPLFNSLFSCQDILGIGWSGHDIQLQPNSILRVKKGPIDLIYLSPIDLFFKYHS